MTLHFKTAGELGAAIQRGEISPVDVTRHMLERIERLDSRLHSYFTVTADLALAQARAAEREIEAGRYRGPLHGIPIAIKDLCDTEGVRTTAGTRVMAGRVPARDATVVARLKNAGAVMLGKLAMTEGAHAEHHPDYPTPVNPWNPTAWTGVSSSGSGVAVAAGLCFAALGSDTGGSIRFPSAMNGIVGIKPTWGRVSRAGIFPMAASLDHVGPMCRTVADTAAVLAVIAGRDPADVTSAAEPVADYAAAARATPDGVRGLRVGFDPKTVAPDREIGDAVVRAVEMLRKLGAEVAEVELPAVDALIGHWSLTCGSEMLLAHEEFFPQRAADYGPGLALFLEMARAIPAVEAARSHVARLEFAGELRALFASVDVLACPTLALPAPAGISILDPEGTLLMSAWMRTTAPFNFSGSPTISLPCGFTAAGVPVSLQLVGRHFEEATIIRAAAAYEAATEWHLRHPELG
jgi:amidase